MKVLRLACLMASILLESSLQAGSLDGLFPFTKVDTPPVQDGRLQTGEYPSSFTGLVDSNAEDRALSELPAAIYTAADEGKIYIAATVELPSADYVPVSSSGENNDRLLVARGDLFVLFIRPDQEKGRTNYSGIYLTVAPNGAVYQARQSIDWDSMNVVRTPDKKLPITSASVVDDGIWTVEMAIPRTLIHNQDKFLFSGGFSVDGHRPSLAPHLVWWDHFDAFVQGSVSSFAVVSDFADQQGQLPAVSVAVSSPEAANPLQGDVETTVIEGTVTVTSEGYNYDQQIGQRIALQEGKEVFSNRVPVAISPGKALQITESIDVPMGTEFLVEQMLRIDGEIVFQRRIPRMRTAPLEVEFRPYPSFDSLEVHIRASRGLAAEATQANIVFGSAEQPIESIATEIVNGRGTSVVDLHDVPVGSHPVRVNLLNKTGKVIESFEQIFDKRNLPTWLTDPEGMEALDPDWCPPPWTPVVVEGSSVSVWGREFDLSGSALLAGITSQGEEILEGRGGELLLQLSGDQGPLVFEFGPPEWEHRNEGRVVARRTGEANSWRAAATLTIEFDGFCRIDLEVYPDHDGKLQQLAVDFPLRDMAFFNGEPLKSARFALPGGQFRFSNGRIGIGFVVDTFRGALVDSRKPRFAVEDHGGNATFKMFPVNVPSSAKDPIRFEFALHPSPYRPLWSGWRDLRPARASRPSQANVQFLTHRQWTDGQRPYPSNWELFRYRVELDHQDGYRVYPYSCPSAFAFYRQYPPSIGERLSPETISSDPARAASELNAVYHKRQSSVIRMKRDSFIDPDPEYFFWEWPMEPARFEHSHTGQPTLEYHYLAMDGSWQDFFVHSIAEGFRRTGVDGYYFDLAAPQSRFQNLDEQKGFAFTTFDGVVEGSFPYFATRNFYKRLYEVARMERGETRPYYFVHGSNSIPGVSSFWDVAFSGESLRGINEEYGLTRTLVRTAEENGSEYDAALFKAQFDSRASGIPTMFLPQYTYHAHLQTEEMAREILSLTTVHNTLVWPYHNPTWPFLRFWEKVEIPFGMGSAEFFPYGTNGIEPGNPAVKVSYWINPETGSRLFIASNWSAETANPSIQLPLDSAIERASDPETGDLVDLVDGVWCPVVPAHDLRVLRIDSASKRK